MTFAPPEQVYLSSPCKTYQGDVLIPIMREIWSMAGLLFFYLASDSLFGESSHLFANFVGPLVMSVILGSANWQMIRKDGTNLWTTLFWFRLSTIVYFGFGTVLVYLVNDDTRLYMESFFAFTDRDIFKHNLIVTLSVILTLVMARIVLLATRRSGIRSIIRAEANQGSADRRLLVSAIIFLGLGLSINYIFVIPYAMGWTKVVLPGAVMNLKNMIPVGVFFITLWSLRKARWLLPSIWVLISIQMLFELLMYAKVGVLMLLVMISLAFVWDKVTLKKLLIMGAIIWGTYLSLKPMVSYARHEIGLRYGSNTQAGFGERLEILGSYLKGGTGTNFQSESDVQNGLSRLSYINAAAFVVYLYDEGRPSNWPELLPAVLVPRFFWKDKPIITGIGTEIYELGRGHKGSSSGTGIFAETYWAMGWWGVIIFMSAYGLIVGGLTRFSSNIMHEERWLYFPVVLMGLKYGMRTDGHYISDVAGALVILVALYVILRIFEVMFKTLIKTKSTS